jgi:hypothetical protein
VWGRGFEVIGFGVRDEKYWLGSLKVRHFYGVRFGAETVWVYSLDALLE